MSVSSIGCFCVHIQTNVQVWKTLFEVASWSHVGKQLHSNQQLVVCVHVLYGLQLMVIAQPPTDMQPVSGFLTLLYEYSYKQNICVLPR